MRFVPFAFIRWKRAAFVRRQIIYDELGDPSAAAGVIAAPWVTRLVPERFRDALPESVFLGR
jgi:hypothetical protein